MGVKRTLKTIDLCSGAGGWACAARGLPIDIIMAVDLWPAACTTYQLNHPATEVVCGDLRDEAMRAKVLHAAARHKVDLIVGGIPCEWLSTYRVLQKVKKEELAAQRATLDYCLGLVKAVNPRFWCLEDVKQLAAHLPLMTPWVELNSKYWGGQRRKRIFVGDFPPPSRPPADDPGRQKLLRDYVRPGPYRIGKRAHERIPQKSRTFSREFCLGAWLDSKGPTVTGQNSRRDGELVIVDPSIAGGKRNPEWQELAALQGFPTDYVFYGSPTDATLMVGRAIDIMVGRAILTSIVAKAKKEKVIR